MCKSSCENLKSTYREGEGLEVQEDNVEIKTQEKRVGWVPERGRRARMGLGVHKAS